MKPIKCFDRLYFILLTIEKKNNKNLCSSSFFSHSLYFNGNNMKERKKNTEVKYARAEKAECVNRSH